MTPTDDDAPTPSPLHALLGDDSDALDAPFDAADAPAPGASDGDATAAPIDASGDDGDDSWGPLQERFSAYIDGELEPEERAAFEAELEADAGLKAEFEAFRDTVSALSSLRVAHPAPELDPDAFVRRVEGTIRSRSRGRFFVDDIFYRTRLPYELFAVIMLALIASVMYLATPDAPEIRDNSPAADAMGGDPEAPPSKTTAPDGAAPPSEEAPSKARPAPVKPMRVERRVYTITLRDAAPSKRAESLTRDLKATSSAWTIERRDDGDHPTLALTLPRADAEGLLSTYGAQGTVRTARAYTTNASGEDAQRTVVTFHILTPDAPDPATPSPPRPSLP